MNQEAHTQSKFDFNFLMLIEQRYREVFIPPLQLKMSPTEFEKLLMFHADSVLNLLESIKMLPDYKYIRTHVILLRTCFEIAVEVELLTNAGKLFPESDNPEKIILERCKVLMQRMMIKEWYIYKENPNHPFSKLAVKKCIEYEKDVKEQEKEIFGKIDHNRSHWWNNTFKDRIKKLDSLINNDKKFERWYDSEYRPASQFVHGTVSPWNSMLRTSTVVSGIPAFFLLWSAEVICDHIMKPISKYIKISDSNTFAFKNICESIDKANNL